MQTQPDYTWTARIHADTQQIAITYFIFYQGLTANRSDVIGKKSKRKTEKQPNKQSEKSFKQLKDKKMDKKIVNKIIIKIF